MDSISRGYQLTLEGCCRLPSRVATVYRPTLLGYRGHLLQGHELGNPKGIYQEPPHAREQPTSRLKLRLNGIYLQPLHGIKQPSQGI